MTTAEAYRKRADALRKKGGQRQSKVYRDRLVRKAKALRDMADNEDWLDGRATSVKPIGGDVR